MFCNNKIKIKRYVISFSMLLLIMTSCIVLKPYKHPDVVSNDKLYRELSVGDTINIANIPWKEIFTDTLLQNLVDEALQNNTDMQIAIARVKKAEANLKQSKAAFFPSLSATGNASLKYNESTGSDITQSMQAYGASSWEADIWGKLTSSKRAYKAAFLASDAYKRAVQTQLIASVATTYYTLLAYDEKLLVTEKTLAKRDTVVETMKLFKESDVVTGADLVQSEANRYSAAVTIPDLKQSIYETENSLSILLGRTPGAISRASLAEQNISIDLKTGLPAQLLANRPDVQQAEYNFRYYFELTNVARAYFYPSVSISANGGFNFDPTSLFWNLTAGLAQPLFSQGVNKQRLGVASANQEEYLAAFKQTLLEAGAEVTNAMHAYQSATEKMSIRATQIEYLKKSVDYTTELMKYTSSTNYTDVLLSETNLLSAQLSSVSDKLQQLQAIVTLYHCLGGGWIE